MKPMDRKLAARLLDKGLVDPVELKAAEGQCDLKGVALAECLVARKLVDPKELAKVQARLFRMEFLDLEGFKPSEEALAFVSRDMAVKYHVLPVAVVDQTLVVAVADPSNVLAMDELRVVTGRAIEVVMAVRLDLDTAIQAYFPAPDSGRPKDPDRRTTAAVPIPQPPISDDSTQDIPRRPPEPAPLTEDRQTAIDRSNEAAPTATPTEERPRPPRESSRDSTSSQETILDEEPTRRVPADRTPPAPPLTMRLPAPVPDSGRPSGEMPRETPVSMLLNHMIEDVLATSTEELEICPPAGMQVRVRARRAGVWRDIMPYPISFHEPIIARLRLLASATLQPRDEPVECPFLLPTPYGAIPVVAFFTPTTRGDRCLLRFPDSLPLMETPLRTMGLRPELLAEFERRLEGHGGGVLFITTDSQRLTTRIYGSMMAEQAIRRSVVSIEPAVERALPNVSQIECRTREAVVRAMDHVARQHPDIFGTSSIPDSDSLRDTVAAAVHGMCGLACFTALDATQALSLYRAAGLDATTLVRGVIAHVHLSQAPRLCGKCRQPVTTRPSLPDWAEAIAGAKLFESMGCKECNGDGRAGTSLVAEVYRPNPAGTHQMVCVQSRAESLCRVAMDGWLDIRDVK